jgi:hypothetical protein
MKCIHQIKAPHPWTVIKDKKDKIRKKLLQVMQHRSLRTPINLDQWKSHLLATLGSCMGSQTPIGSIYVPRV